MGLLPWASTGHEAIAKATPLHIDYVRRVFLDAASPQQLDVLAALSEAVLSNLEEEASSG